MKKLITLISLLLLGIVYNVDAQIFWTENFESGSTSGKLAGTYSGPNGAWTTTSTGTNGADHNTWFVSCAENGHTAGVCGTSCVGVSTTATLATLHVGANSSFGGVDGGASYDVGGFCPILTCPQTNQRAESPTINCTGKIGITMSFNYIENGDGTNDDATVWYYDGSTWALLVNTPKTPLCSGQGQWTHYSIALPTSANNNANVKIGFNWTDNDDGLGTDPSFAVDSVSLKVASSTGPTASFTTSATTVCQDSCIIFTSTSTGTIDSIRWVACVAGIPVYLLGNSTPYNLCFPSTLLPAGTYGMRLRAYGSGVADSTTTSITINPAPHPAITKTGTVLSVPAVYTGYQWSNTSGKITGATNNTYTYTTPTIYTVVVDSAGCKGSATINVGPLGVSSVNGGENNYWVSQSTDGAVMLYAAATPDEPLTASVYDATGRMVLTETWQAGSSTKQLSELSRSPGLYIIKLSNPATSIVLKLLRQ